MLDINKIYNEDCLEGIKRIDDASVKSIVTDPPYFMGITHNGQKGVFNDLIVCKPFFTELYKEMKRVLLPCGCVYWFTDWRGYAFYYPIMEAILPVKNMLVWDKSPGRVGKHYWFSHELIIFANNGVFKKCDISMKNVISIKGFTSGAKATNGEKQHPAQKPTELIEKLITDSTEEGDLVLDCFMGSGTTSGTTAIACMNTKRNFIGFEIDENYYEICQERIRGNNER